MSKTPPSPLRCTALLAENTLGERKRCRYRALKSSGYDVCKRHLPPEVSPRMRELTKKFRESYSLSYEEREELKICKTKSCPRDRWNGFEFCRVHHLSNSQIDLFGSNYIIWY